jgi:hypothetical protein
LSRLSTTSDAARWPFPDQPFGLGAAAGHPPRRTSSTCARTLSRRRSLRMGPPAPPTRSRGVLKRSLGGRGAAPRAIRPCPRPAPYRSAPGESRRPRGSRRRGSCSRRRRSRPRSCTARACSGSSPPTISSSSPACAGSPSRPGAGRDRSLGDCAGRRSPRSSARIPCRTFFSHGCCTRPRRCSSPAWRCSLDSGAGPHWSRVCSRGRQRSRTRARIGHPASAR